MSVASPVLAIPSHLDRSLLLASARKRLPLAFDAQSRLLAPVLGQWQSPDQWSPAVTPIDGLAWAELPQLTAAQADEAVRRTAKAYPAWSALTLEQRVTQVGRALELLRGERDLLVGLLAWDIGKTWRTAASDVDRCIEGVEWYLQGIGDMLADRQSIGLVSNIASWNYPFSVLLTNVLVQALAGNSVVAKIPAQGGGVSLTVAFGLLFEAGLPVSLLGGSGRVLSPALVAHPDIAGLAFVGGRRNGQAVEQQLRGAGKRYALEMEGVNAYAITGFSQWSLLRRQIRAGFDYGKQRCTAYTRWVVERSLLDSFVQTWREAVADIRTGHPFQDDSVDFGPLISAAKVSELRQRIDQAVQGGARVLYAGQLVDDSFASDQDRSAYLAPHLVVGAPVDSELYRSEPFGPVDLVVPVDSTEELVAEANASGGALVAAVGCDDVEQARQLAGQIQAYKVGINGLRSRGDRDEAFGGLGGSWQGAYVGGRNLVLAFTQGEEPAPGRWPD
ncbi:aldehyde dehydrogenase family protein [Frateuria aurantia]